MRIAPDLLSALDALRVTSIVAVVVMVLCIVTLGGGCSSNSTTNSPPASPEPSPTGSITPGPSPSPTPTAVNYVIIAYSSIKPTTIPTFGAIDGYGQASAAPATPLPTVVSKVITVPCNQTIAFYNLDALLPHTASLLMPPTPPPWPVFNNVNGPTPSNQYTAGQLTPITYPQFSTGTLTAYGGGASTSAVYSTGSTPGVFFFGDYTYYTFAPAMRGIINIGKPPAFTSC